jgi:hypothetical protein
MRQEIPAKGFDGNSISNRYWLPRASPGSVATIDITHAWGDAGRVVLDHDSVAGVLIAGHVDGVSRSLALHVPQRVPESAPPVAQEWHGADRIGHEEGRERYGDDQSRRAATARERCEQPPGQEQPERHAHDEMPPNVEIRPVCIRDHGR